MGQKTLEIHIFSLINKCIPSESMAKDLSFLIFEKR